MAITPVSSRAMQDPAEIAPGVVRGSVHAEKQVACLYSHSLKLAAQ